MWAVVVQPNAMSEAGYGLFASQVEALRFAEYAAAEIDPSATVIPMMSPLTAALVQFEQASGLDAYTEAVEALISNGLMADLKQTAPAASPARAITTESHTQERTEP